MRGRAAARLYRSSSVAAAPGYGVASLFRRVNVHTYHEKRGVLNLKTQLKLKALWGSHARSVHGTHRERPDRETWIYTRMHTTLHHDVHTSTTYLLQTPHVSVLPSMEDHSGRGAAPSPRESLPQGVVLRTLAEARTSEGSDRGSGCQEELSLAGTRCAYVDGTNSVPWHSSRFSSSRRPSRASARLAAPGSEPDRGRTHLSMRPKPI